MMVVITQHTLMIIFAISSNITHQINLKLQSQREHLSKKLLAFSL